MKSSVSKRTSKSAFTAIGIDTGGTFTDLVAPPLREGDPPRVVKLPSTPKDPAGAVSGALARVLEDGTRTGAVVHGTTVALNALLTGDVARAALVTNVGFRDLIEIGRQDRKDIYALEPTKPAPLIPRARRFEIGQRSWPAADGSGVCEVAQPTKAELKQLRERLSKCSAKSIAVCLLHSWATPEIERELAEHLRNLNLPLSLSAAIVPEYREVERFSTAIVNAVLAPRMRAYLGPLETRLRAQFEAHWAANPIHRSGASKQLSLSILQSGGGTLPAERAAEEPVRVVLSGPAGGVVGAARAAAQAGLSEIATLDMGGTSADVAFHSTLRGTERRAKQVEPIEVAGYPLAVPSLDIHTIGCGGGSIAWVDAGGALRVGPNSAGADPGPACYGVSDVPTTTDAHLYLGQIRQGSFLGGALELDLDATSRAFENLAKQLGVKPRAAARAVLDSARASMRRALGVMTLQRGRDPRHTPLVAFGGAGGMHAALLCSELEMPAALIPALPGALSAWGMAGAGAQRSMAHSVLGDIANWPRTKCGRIWKELEANARDELLREGHRRASICFERSFDLRYEGQSFELNLPASPEPSGAFHRAHRELYGYELPERAVELVCLRVDARVELPAPAQRQSRSRRAPASACTGEISVDLGQRLRARVFERSELSPGHKFAGPALVEEYSGSTLIPPGWGAQVTAGGHLLLSAGLK